ncbi:MAG: TolC family protein [Candidatus Cloacimonetes bacterium]|nr:TolC family protein [Candidatus Cloacimonadota bacterium]
MRYFIAILLLLPMLLSALTLDECVKLAQENNRELMRQREEIAKIDAEYNNVRGSLFPQITLNAGYQLKWNRLPDSATGGLQSLSDMLHGSDDLNSATSNDSLLIENDQSIAGFTDDAMGSMTPEQNQEETALFGQIQLTQVVFMGGELFNGLRVLDKVKTITRKQYFLVEQDVIYNTKEMYYQTLLAGKVLRIQEDALTIAGQHLQQVTDAFDGGFVSEYNKLRAELEVEKLKPAVLQARNNSELAMQAFKNHLGWKSGVLTLDNTVPETDNLPQFAELDSLLEEGLNNRAELKLSTISVEIEDVRYTIEKQNFLPDVFITGEYNKFTAATDFSIESEDFGDAWQIGLGVSMPLFTGFSNTARRAKTRHGLRQSKIAHEELLQLLELDIRNSWLALEYARQALEVQKKNISLAQRGLEIAQARYDNSVGIQLEVFDAQLKQRSTRLEYENALYSLIIATEKMNKALGRKL